VKGVIFLRKMTLDGRAVGYIYSDSAVISGIALKSRREFPQTRGFAGWIAFQEKRNEVSAG
jgi:hypothetical protein